VPASCDKLLICGTRSFAVEVADLASETPGLTVAGFVENMDPALRGQTLEGRPIVWVDDLPAMAADHVALCALATTHRSRFTDQVAAHGVGFATLVHPSARVSTTSTVGAGAILSAGAIVAAHTHIGQHVLLNRGALVGHHTRIGDHSSVMPGANVAGNCNIGNGVYVGIGAVVIDNVSIGDRSVVGAGAVVTEDVPEHVLVVGVPARIIRHGVPGK
jgi:acetyltransferase EpsM